MSSFRRTLLLACLVSLPALAQQSTRPAITGIAFARFYTTDSEGAQKFYGSTLGFERKEADDMWLYPINHSQWIEILTTPAPPQPNVRLAAVAFTTSDVTQLQRYLEAHSIKVEIPLKNGQFGVRDPEGNLVIFVQRDSEKVVARALGSPFATSTRIIHVGFIVTDRAKEDAFWQQILGFRPYWHGGPKDDVTNWVSLQVPDGTDWLEYMLNAGPNPDLHQSGVMDHFSLGVTRMNDAVAALARNHCEGPNCTKTQMGRDGKVQLNLFDPDQTRVEFMEFAPAQEPCCSPFTAKHPSASDENN
jgi:catechol 2,3-dioxygenase-like lactoylglutathione lyase family enzyme